MTTVKETITVLIERKEAGEDEPGQGIDGLYACFYKNGILHISNRDRKVRRDDVDAARGAFIAAGYREVRSWVPVQGASWLSDGIEVGVSFDIEKVALSDA